jgi:hypothetical protein
VSGTNLAPIIFFGFNRPEHTAKALQALKSNPEAAASRLYLYCDGPRPDETPDGIRQIEEVRRIAASEQWCAEVVLRFRERNVGLRTGLTNGISEVLAEHDRVIVVEDDVIVSPGFLKYMNEALELYASDDRVMHVSGFTPPVDIPSDYQDTTFFYNHTTCWGWGTWARAWQHFSDDGAALMRAMDESGRKRYINLDGAHEYYWALKYLDLGRSSDWNCFWHVVVSLRGGHCLHPVQSLVDNIGFDGSGAQCKPGMDYQSPQVADQLPIRAIPVQEEPRIRRLLTRRPLRTLAELRFKSLARHLYFGLLKLRPKPSRAPKAQQAN